jgi:hypothetical protein
VVEEIGRSNQAEALLEAGDVRSFGRLMNECHVSLRDLAEKTTPIRRCSVPTDGSPRLPASSTAAVTARRASLVKRSNIVPPVLLVDRLA